MKFSRSPLALTNEGDVVLNITEFEVRVRAAEVAEALKRIRGTAFVGVCLSEREVQSLLREVQLVLPNVTAPIGWRRARRR